MTFFCKGQEADPIQWPWQALLELVNDVDNKTSFCGAVLINEDWLSIYAFLFIFCMNIHFI